MQTHHENSASEVHGEYRWRTFDPADTQIHDGTAQEAAEASQLDVSEIEWACGEFGRCDTEFPDENTGTGMVAWIPNEGNGWEWPTAEAPTEDNNYDSPR
jgi:hypothetical protein